MTKKEQERMEVMMALEMFSNYSITLGSNHVLTSGTKLQNGYEIKSNLWFYLTNFEKTEGMDGLNAFIKGYFEECKKHKDAEKLAEFVCIINHKSWYHAANGNNGLAAFYSDWYYEVHDWCMDNLKGKAQKRYHEIVD